MCGIPSFFLMIFFMGLSPVSMTLTFSNKSRHTSLSWAGHSQIIHKYIYLLYEFKPSLEIPVGGAQ